MKEKIKLQTNTKSKSHLHQLIKASLFTTLISIGAFFIIPIKPVSITLQSLFVLLAGVFLTPSYITLSISAYILLGLAGLPVFAGKAGGLEYVFKPSFGYIIGFLFAGLFISKTLRMIKNKNIINIFLIFLTASIIIYLFGLPYMYFALKWFANKTLPLNKIFTAGMIPFIPGDLIKSVCATLITKKLIKEVNIDLK